jgi:hypothetical protein
MSSTRVDQPANCPACKKPGPFAWVAQWYLYDDQHPLRYVEPARALTVVTTTWVCEVCRHRFRVETKTARDMTAL